MINTLISTMKKSALSYVFLMVVSFSISLSLQAENYPKQTYQFSSADGDNNGLDIKLEITFNYDSRSCKGKWIIKNTNPDRVKINFIVKCTLQDGSETERSVIMEIEALSTKQLFRGSMFKFDNYATKIELEGKINIKRFGNVDVSRSTGSSEKPLTDVSQHTASNLPIYSDSAKPLDVIELFKRSTESVVVIKTDDGSGSGILIRDNTILTNCHVVGQSRMVTVIFFNLKDNKPVVSGQIQGTIIFRNSKNDIALVKIPPQSHRPLIKLRQDKPQIGEKIYVIGSPGIGNQILELTLTDGIISGVDRIIEDRPFIQYTAASNPGNSGGPLLDASGLLLGVVTLAANLQNTNFAIPNDHIMGILEAGVSETEPGIETADNSSTHLETGPDLSKTSPDLSETGVDSSNKDNTAADNNTDKTKPAIDEAPSTDPNAQMWKKAKSLLKMAKMMEQNNSMDGALGYYKQIVEEYPKSPQAEIAQKRIEELEKKK